MATMSTLKGKNFLQKKHFFFLSDYLTGKGGRNENGKVAFPEIPISILFLAVTSMHI